MFSVTLIKPKTKKKGGGEGKQKSEREKPAEKNSAESNSVNKYYNL